MKQYFITVGDALSQLLNAVIFLSNDANESLSGRCHRERYHWFYGRLRQSIDWFFAKFSDYGHCANAYRNDVQRAQRTVESARKLS